MGYKDFDGDRMQKKKEKRVDHFHNAFVKNFRIIIGNFERICVILNDRPDDECYRENA